MNRLITKTEARAKGYCKEFCAHADEEGECSRDEDYCIVIPEMRRTWSLRRKYPESVPEPPIMIQ